MSDGYLIRRGGGGGLNLKVIGGTSRPNSGDTLTWDGNTEGLVSVADVFYKVSNATPSIEDFANGGSTMYNGDAITESNFTIDQITDMSGSGAAILLHQTEQFLVALEDNIDFSGLVIPEKGIYLQNTGELYVSSLTIPGYTGFGGGGSVKDNTIWVNTDTDINGYAFSATEPTSPVEDMVWFVTGASSSAAMNVDKKNTVMLYPSGCYQYIDGAWIKKTALTYLNGAWVAWKLTIYDAGYINTDAIGSFVSVGKQASSTNGGTAAAPTVTYNADNILIYTSNNYKGGIVYTELPVDLTAFSTVNVYAKESGGYAPSLKIYSAIGSYQDSNVAASVTITKGATGTYSVDVSALSGEYFIGFAMLGDSGTGVSLNVYNLWCE